MRIETASPYESDVAALLVLHLGNAQRQNASQAYDATRLSGEDITLFAARDDQDRLMGIAALKILSPTQGEIKSVRTHPDHVRKGVAHALMNHLEDDARANGLSELLLETHTTEAYKAATILYENRGYLRCGPFGDHEETEESLFMKLDL